MAYENYPGNERPYDPGTDAPTQVAAELTADANTANKQLRALIANAYAMGYLSAHPESGTEHVNKAMTHCREALEQQARTINALIHEAGY